MPTIIDEFVALFKIDPKGVEKGAGGVREELKKTREDVDKSNKEFAAFGRQGVEFLSKLRNEAVGLFLAFQGASSVTSFVKNLITGDAATARLAGNIGMATSRLSAWELAIRGVGGEAADADAALSAMTAAFQSYQLTGTTGHDADFKGLGVRLEDLKAGPEQVLLKLAEAAERMDKTEFFARASRLGIPPSVINQLERGRKATEDLIAAKEKDGAATDADAAAAERLQQKLSDLQSHMTHLVRPAIYGVVTVLDDAATAMGDASKAGPILAGALGVIATAAALAGAPFIALAAAIGAVITAVKNWQQIKDTIGTVHSDTAATAAAEAKKKKAAGGFWGMLGNIFTIHSDPAAGAPTAALPNVGQPKSGADQAYMAKYLKARGLSDEQVKGIVAGITAEGGSATAVNPKSGAFGVGQWLGPRQRELFRRYGRRPSLQQQLEFLVWELNGGDPGKGGASVLSQTSASGAMVAYLRDFMRPGRDLPADLSRGYQALGQRGPVYAGNGAGAPMHNDNSTHIGTIVVNDASGDANRIAAQLPGAIERRKLTTQANRGMQ